MMSKEQKKNYVDEMKKVFSSNEAVMIAHYKGLNVKELDKIRNEMLIMDFPAGKIEPSLGGMLRVIHAMKKGKNKYKISPGLKSYFRERLELESYHIDYIMKKSEKIAQIN